MSISSLGILGGLASSQLAQRAAETDRAGREGPSEARATQAAEQAESAAGIGQTEEDAQTSERDADGRRLWEQSTASKKSAAPAPPSDPASHLSKDATHTRGSHLDLLG
jgi:hypothetical protein